MDQDLYAFTSAPMGTVELVPVTPGLDLAAEILDGSLNRIGPCDMGGPAQTEICPAPFMIRGYVLVHLGPGGGSGAYSIAIH